MKKAPVILLGLIILSVLICCVIVIAFFYISESKYPTPLNKTESTLDLKLIDKNVSSYEFSTDRKLLYYVKSNGKSSELMVKDLENDTNETISALSGGKNKNDIYTIALENGTTYAVNTIYFDSGEESKVYELDGNKVNLLGNLIYPAEYTDKIFDCNAEKQKIAKAEVIKLSESDQIDRYIITYKNGDKIFTYNLSNWECKFDYLIELKQFYTPDVCNTGSVTIAKDTFSSYDCSYENDTVIKTISYGPCIDNCSSFYQIENENGMAEVSYFKASNSNSLYSYDDRMFVLEGGYGSKMNLVELVPKK